MAKADSFRKVAEDLWFWDAYEESVRSDLSSCAIAAEDGLVLVDPIDLNGPELDVLGDLGSFVAIVLTNGNHSRSAMRFRKRFNIPIFAHEDAVGELEIPVDGMLKSGRLVGGSLQVVCLPGGGPGEVGLYDGRGRLHLGDALVNLDSTGFSVLPAKYCSDQSLLKESLKTALALMPKIITFAHGPPIVMDAEFRFAALLEGSRE